MNHEILLRTMLAALMTDYPGVKVHPHPTEQPGETAYGVQIGEELFVVTASKAYGSLADVERQEVGHLRRETARELGIPLPEDDT